MWIGDILLSLSTLATGNISFPSYFFQISSFLHFGFYKSHVVNGKCKKRKIYLIQMCAACQVGHDDSFIHGHHHLNANDHPPPNRRTDPHSHTLGEYFRDSLTSTLFSIVNLFRMAVHGLHDSISFFVFSVLVRFIASLISTTSKKNAMGACPSSSSSPSCAPSGSSSSATSTRCAADGTISCTTTEEPSRPHRREDEERVRAKQEKWARRQAEMRRIAELPIDLDMASGCQVCGEKGYLRKSHKIRVGPPPRIVNNMYIFTTLHYIGVSCIIKANRLTWLNLLLMHSQPIACFITKFSRGNTLTMAEHVGEILSTFLVMVLQTFFVKYWFDDMAHLPFL